MKTLIYLASNYSHPNEEVREARYLAVLHHTHLLIKQGYHVFSPIVHCHPIAVKYGLPTDHEYWHTFNRAFLSVSKRMIILTLDQWTESLGIKSEIDQAKELRVPISYLEPAPGYQVTAIPPQQMESSSLPACLSQAVDA